MKKSLVVLILILILIIIGAFWWQRGNLAVNKQNTTPVIFEVKNGDGVREIANNLKEEGLIRDPIVFFLITKQSGLDKKIQAGDFRLNSSMNAYEIANALTHGTLDIWVTIPEGQRANEIADILKEKMPNYDESWRASLTENEGYLFPDTYLVPRGADIDTIINLLRSTFESKYSQIGNPKTDLTKEELVTVASMVEREARHDKDRPLVASVILNRLGIGMKLDIDATIQYALGYQNDQKRWWKKSLTINDLDLNSPYNTYKVNGLPPTPISNPGLESLMAVANPANTEYLYYMTDAKGINHYATTLEGHQQNIKTYGL